MDKLINQNRSKKSMSEQIAMMKKGQNTDMIDTKNVLFIVDCSGSMGSHIQGKEKYTHMKDMLIKMNAVNIISFGNGAQWINVDQVDARGASTPMHKAFVLLNESKKKYDSIILISDGSVDYPSETLDHIRAHNQRIESVFIGHDDDDGYIFMQEIARVSGGTAQNIDTGDVNFVHLLQEQITLLLEN